MEEKMGIVQARVKKRITKAQWVLCFKSHVKGKVPATKLDPEGVSSKPTVKEF